MTQLLYFDADVLSEQASVLACTPGQDGHAVTLDRTLFHPQGGGQPSDVGHIGAAQVRKVLARDGAVVHWVDRPVALGPVSLEVDAQTRQLHARLHSAGHLIGHAVAGLGLSATRAHHWPGESRVLVADAKPLALAHLQSLVDDLIHQNLPRIMWMLGDRREVGFGELAAFPCGGTHVKFTGEVGRCVIDSVSPHKDGQWIRYSLP